MSLKEKFDKFISNFFYEPMLYLIQIFVGAVIFLVIICFLQLLLG